ncbi:hypothetical protein K488DRAFT_75285 [Vararia minispora EC-137]|uniref:Uncharacterized protein n=1 Tax=Vararia minispora EC-137 TaxID=1314806 RepID=A0ACB8Q4C1_9AGAM|nr:hypothetical protein K488DRAFT_75285 [Vararia minispora EC-137]
MTPLTLREHLAIYVQPTPGPSCTSDASSWTNGPARSPSEHREAHRSNQDNRPGNPGYRDGGFGEWREDNNFGDWDEEDEALAQGGIADNGRVSTLSDNKDVEDNALDLEEATLGLGDDFQDLDLQNDDTPIWKLDGVYNIVVFSEVVNKGSV